MQALLGRSDTWFWVRNGWQVGRNVALMAMVGTKSGNAIVDRAVVYGENIVRGGLERDLHVAMVSFHYGAWEYLPQVFRRLGRPVTVMTGVQRTGKLDNVLTDLRRSNGVRLVRGLRSLRVGLARPGVTGFMLDNTSRGKRVWPTAGSVRFGMPRLPFRLQAPGPGAVGQRAQSIGVVPAFARFCRGRLHVRVYPPGNDHDALRALLHHVGRRPEDWVFWGKAGAVTAE